MDRFTGKGELSMVIPPFLPESCTFPLSWIASTNVQPSRPEDAAEIAKEMETEGVRKVMLAVEPGSSRLLCDNGVYAALQIDMHRLPLRPRIDQTKPFHGKIDVHPSCVGSLGKSGGGDRCGGILQQAGGEVSGPYLLCGGL